MKLELLKIPGKERISETIANGPLYPVDTPSPGCFIMSKKIEYFVGQKLGECIYLEEKAIRCRYLRRALFLCLFCGNKFETQIGNVSNYHTRSCGCISGNKHGLSSHPLYNRWNVMNDRCNNPNNKRYEDWGGRGIKVFPDWIHDFKAFYDYVTNLPGYDLTLTIDRIDNDGDYVPKNLKWSTIQEQNNNNRKIYKNSKNFKRIEIIEKRYS